MRYFIGIIYTVIVAIITVLWLPIAMIAGGVMHVKDCVKAYWYWLKKIVKGDENEISKEQSEEETQVDEEPKESVFEDVGV